MTVGSVETQQRYEDSIKSDSSFEDRNEQRPHSGDCWHFCATKITMRVQKRRQLRGLEFRHYRITYQKLRQTKTIKGETELIKKSCCRSMPYTVLHGCLRFACGATRSGFFGRATSKEREQVLAHSELFLGTAWYPEVEPHHWCKAVGIRRDDSPGYIDAIAANLAGKNPSAFTLAAIEKSRNKIAGYVFCCAPDNDSPETLAVGHLKVDTEYQRRGVGSMLLAAAETHAYQRGWRCREARLSVLAENRPARSCYEKAGFQQTSSSFVELAEGIEHEVQWLRMARALESPVPSKSRERPGIRLSLSPYRGRDPGLQEN